MPRGFASSPSDFAGYCSELERRREAGIGLSRNPSSAARGFASSPSDFAGYCGFPIPSRHLNNRAVARAGELSANLGAKARTRSPDVRKTGSVAIQQLLLMEQQRLSNEASNSRLHISQMQQRGGAMRPPRPAGPAGRTGGRSFF